MKGQLCLRKQRYYNYKEGSKDKQRIYLDLDVFDNHYPQSVMLCYLDESDNQRKLNLATDYITPIKNPVKNGGRFIVNVEIERESIFFRSLGVAVEKEFEVKPVLSVFKQTYSLDEENKPKETIWPTQPFASYYGDRYIIPMGSYVYL